MKELKKVNWLKLHTKTMVEAVKIVVAVVPMKAALTNGKKFIII